MDSSDSNTELSGLARSIEALFLGWRTPEPRDAVVGRTAGDADGPAPGEDRTREGPGKSLRPDPEALRKAVDRFMVADPPNREELGHEIRDAAVPLREANFLDSLADAVERLSGTGGEVPDEACVAMARTLLTPGVASRLAGRLGAAREEERRGELTSAFVRLGRDMAVALADALSETDERFARRAYLDAMVVMGEDGMSLLEEMVEDGRWFVVRNAVAILGEVGGGRAVELITGSLAHPDPRVRREGLVSLTKVGGEDAGMLVHGMIEDPDPEVRLAAAMGAGALNVQRALKPLLNVLEGERDPDVVVALLGALGQLGDPGATNAVEKRAVGSFFFKPSTDVRIAAYRALHNIGTPRARRLIQDAATDKDQEVRSAVRHLLGMR